MQNLKIKQMENFINQADENGYIPLNVFCNKVFRLNEFAVASFFEPINPDSCIKNEIEDIQTNIRNTINFVELTKKRRVTNEMYTIKTIEGGIYKDDLELFIEKAKNAITINSRKLIETYDTHFGQK